MRKFTFCTLLILLLSLSASAQIKIGAIAGVNMSKLNGDIEPNTKYTSQTGTNLGLFVDFQLRSNIYLSLQPSYSQEGTKIKHIVNGVYNPIDSISIKLNYVSLPVLLKVTSTNEKFYAIGGLEAAKLASSSKTPLGGESQPIDVQVEPWNFSIQFGAGMRFPIGATTLFLETRYAQGLNNLTQDSIVDDLLPRVKSSSIKILTGIEIPLEFKKI